MRVTDPRVKVEEVQLSKLTLDPSVQLRATLNRQAIIDYAEAWERGDQLPPIVVYYDAHKFWVADGFHRVLARKHNKQKTILAELRPGTRRNAILYSAKANVAHGVRRTNEDKRKAIITLLKDKEWRKWTDSTIAQACCVDRSTVAKYREWLKPERSATHEEIRTYIDREGRERKRAVPVPADRDEDLADRVRLRKCPYCGQAMNGPPVNPTCN